MIEYVNCGFGGITSGLGGLRGGATISDFLRFLELAFDFGGAVGFAAGVATGGGGE